MRLKGFKQCQVFMMKKHAACNKHAKLFNFVPVRGSGVEFVPALYRWTVGERHSI